MSKILLLCLFITIFSCSKSEIDLKKEINQASLSTNPDSLFNAYKTLVEKFPDSDLYPTALFQLGFMSNNYPQLKNLAYSKECYELFLSKYPNHELSESVRFELENLGKSPEELLKNIQLPNEEVKKVQTK
jgi:hypothetical protein